jgi:hypothetical protein
MIIIDHNPDCGTPRSTQTLIEARAVKEKNRPLAESEEY